MNEYKGLIANVANSSKLNKENAGFQTPRFQNIPKGSGAHLSKLNNANLGFVTPVNKTNLSRKTLFSDKSKTALGDLKNTAFNTITPLKSGSLVSEKTKDNVQLATPNFKNNNSNVPVSTLKQSTTLKAHSKCNLDEWNENLVLSDEQFNLLFMEPTLKNDPLTPISEPETTFLHPYVEWSPHVPYEYDSGYNYDTGDINNELPPLDLSFIDDSFLQ